MGTVSLKKARAGSYAVQKDFSGHRGRYFQLYNPFEPVLVHAQCACNEYVAIRNRVQQECPPVQQIEIRMARLVGRLISQGLEAVRPNEFWWTKYSGAKLARYEAAWLSLDDVRLTRSDARISAFIKPEKLLKNGDPRMIQARTIRYNCVLGKYLVPLEHQLYQLRRVPGFCSSDLPLVAKGLHLRRRAQVIQAKMERFGACYSLDLSRFDAHIAIPWLQVEHAVYLRAHGNHPELRKLLSWQLINRCYTRHWRYNSIGGRMSGDMNTALGNCLLMLVMCCVAARRTGMRPDSFDLFIDGDDTLVFTRHPGVKEWPAVFRRMGQELKLEGYTKSFHQVEHCRCRPVSTARGVTMTQNPKRVIARSTAGVRHWQEQKFWQAYLGLLGTCELALSAGLPVLQEYALMLLRWSQGKRPRRWVYLERWCKVARELREFDPVPLPITPEARATMWEAWDICPAEQRALEASFRAARMPWDAT